MGNQPESNENESRLSDTDVRSILERAIELDSARTNEVTLADLRRAAEEAGISSVALMQAFEEHRLGKTARPLPARPIEPLETGWLQRARRLLRPAWLGSTATLLGLLTLATGDDGAALGTFFVTIAGSLVLAILHRSRRRDAVEAEAAGIATADQLLDARNQGWAYLIDLVAIWMPWSVFNGLIDEEIAAIGGLSWSIAAVVGLGIVLLSNPKPALPNTRSRTGAPGPEAAVSS